MDILDMQPDKPEKSVQSKGEIVIPGPTTNPLVTLTSANGAQLSAEQSNVLTKFMQSVTYGHQAALPMTCKALKCPFLKMCPLYKASVELPEGKTCPVEAALISQWVQITMDALHIKDTDPEDAVDMSMIYELAGLEMIRYRAAAKLAETPELIEERVVGYSPQGSPIYGEVPKAALIVLEKYGKMISKLRDQLLATRRSQAMVGNIQNDVSSRGASLMERAKKLAEDRKSAQNNPMDAEFSVLDGPKKPDSPEPS